jgi:hypothetical protein
LKGFVAEGGAIYGSWGGPMFTPDLLNVCHISRTRSVRIRGMMLCDSPLSQGITEKELAFSPRIGHMKGASWEIVSVEPAAGGIAVATDSSERTLGVLAQYGKGRTAVLGFAPDNEKYFVRRELGPVMTDNLLRWLLEDRIRTKRQGQDRSRARRSGGRVDFGRDAFGSPCTNVRLPRRDGLRRPAKVGEIDALVAGRV